MTLAETLRIAGWALLSVGMAFGAIAAMVAAIRWARRAGYKVAAVGGAVMMMFGMGVVPPRELHYIEEAKEPKGKKAGEAGAPPAPDDEKP